ncbi:sugar-binding domain-containing protein [Zunongwangia sp. H14]|uniref:glycoside hydrolase family 2 protein n=1 Tax=Zunongwangia sp. H14 TaxID=3240792 RepID=UPI003562BE95
MRKIFRLLLLFCVFSQSALAQDNVVKQEKITNFELQSSQVIDEGGETLSTAAYKPKVFWFPAIVPSTILSALVDHEVYPDPHIGMNNMRIPDASDEFNETYNLEQYSHIPNVGNPWKEPYWYRTSIKVPAEDKGRHFQLIFKGINYRAAVWMNGKQVADSTEMVGMFAEYSFDVSELVKPGEENVLAVKIYPLDFPGLPSEEQLKAMGDFFPNGGPTGDIGKNVTMLCSVGWDWVPPARDRNIGIWQPVYLRTTGAVTIKRPHIVTELPNLPDTTLARLSLDLSLRNIGSKVQKGTLQVDITPNNFEGAPIHISREINIPAASETTVDINSENTAELQVKDPHLWWPNGQGKANLYNINLRYETDGVVSDDTSFVFGIRTVSSKPVEVKDKFLRRDFYVNGRRIQLVGGAWVPDMLLDRDSTRYDAELHLCRNSNINLIRIWGGGITPPDTFFNLADKYGMLVWSDFWVTGDTHGEFKGSTDWPVEPDVFVDNVKSTIYRIRNHPSLLLWTGGNEGHIRKDVYRQMRQSVIDLDGTRPFIPSSSGFAKLPEDLEGSWPDGKASGVYSSGPYTWQDIEEYYDLANNAKDWVFKDETGLPSQPPYNSLKKIIPDLVWDPELPFPLNNTWGYHDAATGNGRYDLYYEQMVKRYGEPVSMEDFSEKMQLMNAVGYQGIFEAAGSRLNDIGGAMLWKLNAAFPSVIWQIYDWYLQPNAGYYFMQGAVEPVHVQLNPINYEVTVVNRSYKDLKNMNLEVAVFNPASEKLYQKTSKVKAGASNVVQPLSIKKVFQNNDGVKIVVLSLKDESGNLLSHNTYWLAKNDDYSSLNTMKETSLEAEVLNKEQENGKVTWTIKFSNTSGELAFFTRARLLNDGEDVLPVYWKDNYFSLKPEESMNVEVSASADLLEGNNQILLKGWNVKEKYLKLN